MEIIPITEKTLGDARCFDEKYRLASPNPQRTVASHDRGISTGRIAPGQKQPALPTEKPSFLPSLTASAIFTPREFQTRPVQLNANACITATGVLQLGYARDHSSSRYVDPSQFHEMTMQLLPSLRLSGASTDRSSVRARPRCSYVCRTH